MQEEMKDDIEVVVIFDIVETDKSGSVCLGFEGVGWFRQLVEQMQTGGLVSRVQDIEDIVQRWVGDGVAFRQDVELLIVYQLGTRWSANKGLPFLSIGSAIPDDYLRQHADMPSSPSLFLGSTCRIPDKHRH